MLHIQITMPWICHMIRFFSHSAHKFLTVFFIIFMIQDTSFAGGKAMFNIVELKGSYYEIGRGWGTAFKGEMDKVVQTELGIISRFYGINIDAVVELGRKYLPIAKSYDPDFVEVLQGFAEGAEVEFNTLFAIRTTLEILFYTSRPEGMCTSFAIAEGATNNGQTIIGQNIDWHPGLPMALLRIEWPNGVKQFSLSMSGIWEYSLSSHASSSPYGVVSTLTATPDEDPANLTVPISIIMNKASRQKNLNEALSVFTEAKSNLASFLLANGNGEIAGIELGLRSFEKLLPENDILVHANHYLSERYLLKDIFLPFVPDSPGRYKRLTELLKQDHRKTTPELLMKYLSDHNNGPKGVCTHVDPKSELPPSATLASVIMVPEEKIIYGALGNPCENEFIRYELNPK